MNTESDKLKRESEVFPQNLVKFVLNKTLPPPFSLMVRNFAPYSFAPIKGQIRITKKQGLQESERTNASLNCIYRDRNNKFIIKLCAIMQVY